MPKLAPNAPLQYQKGWSEFYKLKFRLTTDVLIPRPETELLVENIIDFASYQLPATSYQPTIIDIGTGSGCIAISLARNLPKAKIIAIDISPKALSVAKLNAKYHKVEKRIIFFENDLLTNFKVAPDIIVANLPYIPTSKLMYLDPLVRDFEPKIALDGGSDGFELYKTLFTQIVELNIYPKLLICEMDETQGDLAKHEAKKYFPNATIELKKDLNKKDRFLKVIF